jgi:hypothetical protein
MRSNDAGAYRPGRQAAILLRPHGHIAWRSSRLDPAGLVAWLRCSLDRKFDATDPSQRKLVS